MRCQIFRTCGARATSGSRFRRLIPFDMREYQILNIVLGKIWVIVNRANDSVIGWFHPHDSDLDVAVFHGFQPEQLTQNAPVDL